MVLGKSVRFAVELALLASASEVSYRSEGVAAGGSGAAGQGSPLDLDPSKLPYITDAQAPPVNPEDLQPQDCTYSSEDAKDAVLRLTALPSQGLAFRCPGDDDISPLGERFVYRVGSDGSCDTSSFVSLRDVTPGSLDTVPARGQRPSYKVFFSDGSPIDADKQFCFACTAKAGQDKGKKCNIFVTVPRAQLTNAATCDGSRGQYVVAAFKEDQSDLTATFTCAAEQTKLLPSLESKKAETGDFCKQNRALTEIVDGASLSLLSAKSGGAKSYKLTLGSLPEKPRLFCFRCAKPGLASEACDVFVYAPASKGGKPNKRSGGQSGGLAVVTTTPAPNSAHGAGSLSALLLYIGGVFVASCLAGLHFP